MGELVEDRDDAAFLDGVGDLGTEHVGLGEGDRAGVLHRAGVELGHEELVVLLERIGVVELLLVEGEALPRLLEDVVGVEEPGEALAGVHAERDGATVTAGQFAVDRLVGARDESRDVGGDHGGGGEGPGLRALSRVDRLRGGGVADDAPVRRSGHREGELRLEVGLLEDREHPPGVRHLELAVQIHLAVDRVDEAVQAFSGVRVQRVGDDGQLVLIREIVEPDARTVTDVGRVELDPVEGDRVHRSRDGVDERGRALPGAEPHGGRAAERLRPGREVEYHVVAAGRDERCALLGFDAGEVFSGQR